MQDKTPGSVAELHAVADWVRPALYLLEQPACLIGRAPECDVVVLVPLASRQHARIDRVGSQYVLTDLKSANGTFVNGRRISEPYTLASDDLIGFGAITFSLRFLDMDETIQAQPPLTFDEHTLQFYLGREPVQLTQQQLRFLRLLYQHAGRVCTRDQCATAVWGEAYDPGADAGRLDQLVSSVRRELRQAHMRAHEDTSPATELIEARRGLGYRLIM